jgi:RNA 2',3'-cyclic 3'-phosphodiesterase
MRAFVAIKTPPNPALERCHRSLSSLGGGVKAVLPANMHLTLKFIGETALRPSDILMALERATSAHPRFVLGPSGPGAFPNWSRPNVVWIGLGEARPCEELARSIEDELGSSFSIPEETRPFSPHLTLARVKGPARTSDLRSIAEEACGSLMEWGYVVPVDDVHLMGSQLTPCGPIYETLGKVPLGG